MFSFILTWKEILTIFNSLYEGCVVIKALVTDPSPLLCPSRGSDPNRMRALTPLEALSARPATSLPYFVAKFLLHCSQILTPMQPGTLTVGCNACGNS